MDSVFYHLKLDFGDMPNLTLPKNTKFKHRIDDELTKITTRYAAKAIERLVNPPIHFTSRCTQPAIIKDVAT